MKLLLKLSCVFCCYWLLLLLPINPPSPGAFAQIYQSRNECVSNQTIYEIHYAAREFVVRQEIIFHVLSPVKNCYFYAENFTVFQIQFYDGFDRAKASLEGIGRRSIAISMISGAFFHPDHNYTLKLSARKPILPVSEGLVFKVYRDMWTMKMTWYSIVKIGPASCGKVYICINSLRSVQKLRIIAVHPNTHRLFCPGIQSEPIIVDNYFVRSECILRHPVSVNNMHFSVADFLSMHYDGLANWKTPHRISMVLPKDVLGNIYYDIVQQFEVILKIYSILLLTTNIKPFDVYFYVLPNNEISEPVISGSVCYFNFENIHFQLNLEENYLAYIRCLLHQGYMVHRRADSWSLSYAPEGLFEKYVTQFEVFGNKRSYFRDAIEGDDNDLAALSKSEDWTRIQSKRPWRKAAGFFSMLAAINPAYGVATYTQYVWNNGTSMENNHTHYLNWITRHTARLGISVQKFLEVIETWTMADGYPVITVEVILNQSVCVSQYSEGVYLKSYILPIQVDFNFPNVLHARTIWTDPKSSDNCARVQLGLYPYLINSFLNMVGRVHYDTLNWKIWSEEIMIAAVRNSLTPMQRVTLVTDALFFAGQRKLSYSIALRFLFAMQAEELEEAWRNFDKTLTMLDARVRYTGVYTLYRKTVAQLVERYYNASMLLTRPSETAYKWSCMMGSMLCLNEARQSVDATLMDHRFRHPPEVLCGGMRRLRKWEFHKLIYTLGRPDFREPEFYIQMMLCSEDPKILRELLHHLFFHNTWRFRKKKLTDMLIRMIQMSKTGSEAAFHYLNHDPVGMCDVIGKENIILVVEELAKYTKENGWFLAFVRRLKRSGNIWEALIKKQASILHTLRENKRWHNTQYREVRRFFVTDFGRLIWKFESFPTEDLANVVDL